MGSKKKKTRSEAFGYLVIRDGKKWSDVFRLVPGRTVTIGRSPTNQIVVKEDQASRKHAEIFQSDGKWTVRDLNSRNGTKVDNRTVVRKRLDPGCKLSIARHEYIVEFDPQSLGAYGPPPGDDDYGDELMRSSLMDRAGLDKRDKANPATRKSVDED